MAADEVTWSMVCVFCGAVGGAGRHIVAATVGTPGVGVSQ